ncbi:MAG TPA: hypothetical protein VG844_00455 [Terracidiphilus sp.]|nr:hypothetical protein [Terracidiphilus sp.]
MASGKELIKSRWILEAAGAALLLVGPYFYPMLLPGNVALYHHYLNFTNMIGGIFLVLAGVFLLLLAALVLLSRLPRILHCLAEGLLSGAAIWLFLQPLTSLYSEHLREIFFAQVHPTQAKISVWSILPVVIAKSMTLAIALPLCLALIAYFKVDMGSKIARTTRMALAAFAFCGIWIVPQLAYLAYELHATPPFNRIEAASSQQSHPQGPVIWLLFDELSENLIYDHPPEGMQFPEFARFRASSVSFSNVDPVGYFTESVIPSLLAGKPIEKISSTIHGDLLYYDETQRRWIRFDAKSTLFGLADQRGLNPAIVGWYNPYCRTFAETVSACRWQASPFQWFPLEQLGATEYDSALHDTSLISRNLLRAQFLSPKSEESFLLDARIKNYHAIMSRADSLIRDGKSGFIFIHLPIPHPPGFYDRRSHMLCKCGNYLDNLVLAEDTLGHLLNEIHHSPQGDKATLIVSSDHSWRVPLWSAEPSWTKEEARVSNGQFDPRPVLMVHFPGETAKYGVAQKAPELLEHDILAALLNKEISTPQQLIDKFNLQVSASGAEETTSLKATETP